jgi:hypothetical protein
MEKSILIITVTFGIVLTLFKLIKEKLNFGLAKDPSVFKLKSKDKGAYRGIEYSYKYTSGSQHNRSSFSITVEFPCEGSFEVSKLTRFDRFFIRTGFSKDIRTGYPDFDDKFLVDTDREEFTEAYFTSAVKRQAAIEMFDLGFKEIKCDSKNITVIKSPVKKKSEIDGSLIEQVMERLILLMKDVPQDVIKRVEVRSNYQFKKVALYVISVLSL